jgi:hypothetical protein
MTAKCISPKPQRDSRTGHRRCLACRRPFASAGPHEWVCPRCKESEIWIAGTAEFACHAGGGEPTGRAAEGE